MEQRIVKPRKVEIMPQAIVVLWEDGHVCRYAHHYLRLQCRCAGCVGEWPHRHPLDASTVPEDVQALDYMPVGNYALQFLWSDAHYTGIYPFTLLRELCPPERPQSPSP